MIDLRSVIASFGAPLLLKRRAAGVWNEGVYVPPAAVTVTVRASVQPAGASVKPLPEGVRVEDVKIVYANGVLRTASDPEGTMADRFDYEGMEFEVFRVENWSTGGQGLYYKALAARVRDRAEDQA